MQVLSWLWQWLKRLVGAANPYHTNREILLEILRTTSLIKERQGIMADELTDLVAAMDAETTAVAARLDKISADLAAAIADGKAPDPAVMDHLRAVSDRLKALGADPANPIPAPAPDPAPTA